MTDIPANARTEPAKAPRADILPPSHLDRFTRAYAPGETIFRKGSRGSSMFVVIEGGVQIMGDADDVGVLVTLGIGQSFGEIALVDEGVRTATVRSIGMPTLLAEIDRARFVYLVGQQPAFALTVLRGLARRIKALTREGVAAGEAAP